jgi:hypothetical protein
MIMKSEAASKVEMDAHTGAGEEAESAGAHASWRSSAGKVEIDWQLAHRELSRLARSRAGLDFEEGQWLLAAWQSGVHARLGHGSFREYIERLFGYGARLRPAAYLPRPAVMSKG